ncbi:follicle cell protein 3C-1 [Drosophila busckii]|uniref:follicle cell protein 3C-1 n=1 Tax=Drosophila busckii TaxID=30019 RepID=UPI00083F402F|nr:follicle cell protein 3C-1 [Drosophila busckii]
MTMAKVVRLMLSLLLIGVLSQQDIAASKIAYTKPLFGFGKTSYLKEKRFRPKAATASVTTTEADWPAPIEFIISSSAKDLGTTQLPMWSSSSSTDRTTAALNQPVPCTCGVFLSSQIKNGLPETPLIHNEMDRMFPCNAIGRKQCQTKCLETIVQHLPNSANIVCATLGHNCHKERAYLFIKNCHNQWINTNLQAGREYCCKAGVPYRCPLLG